MSILTPKSPKGFEMFQVPTRAGQSASTYSMLSNFFPELLQQAQGAPGAFDALEQQGQNLFNQKIAPGIAQRYAGSGIGASSGMQNALAGAGKDLTLGLQAQRNQLMQNSMNNVMNLGNLLLSNPDYETYFGQKQPKRSIWDSILGIGLPAAGGVIGGVTGGPQGAIAGMNIGQSFAAPFTGMNPGSPDWSGISNLPTTWGKK